MNTRLFSLVVFLFAFVFSSQLLGQQAIPGNNSVTPKGVDTKKKKKKKTSLMDWMMNNEVRPEAPLGEGDAEVTLDLISDFEQFTTKEGRRMQNYQMATVTIDNKDGVLTQEVEIKPRGKFRCMRCDIPPVKLKFHKDTLKEAGLSKMNELKVVLPCKAGEEYENYLMKEFLTYRLYNIITERSFRVQRIDLNLTCTKTGERFEGMEAFLIEHEEELVKRLNGKAIDTMGVGPSGLVREDYRRLQVFQFMIGNTDWIPATEHNCELITIKGEGERFVPIPFDFDFSGLVGTGYAIPNSTTGLTSVKERFFMGNGWTEEELEQTFQLFRDKRNDLLAEVALFHDLDKKERKKMIKYIESFYDVINSKKSVREFFIDREPFQPHIY